MKNVTKGIFVGSFMLLSAFGFSQKSLTESPNGVSIQKYASNAAELKLTQSDVQGLTVTDEYYTKGMDLTLVYVGQEHQGIPIYNAISTVAVKDGQIFNVASGFVSDVASKVNTVTPAITAQQAIEKVASYFKLGTPTGLRVLSRKANNYEFSSAGISSRDFIPAQLKYVFEGDKLVLTYDVEVDDPNSSDMWSVRVDATTGEIRKGNIHNYTISCAFDENGFYNDNNAVFHAGHNHADKAEEFNLFKSNANTSMMVDGSSYRVLPLLSDGSTPGVESPSHGSREVVSDPANVNASPFGWHDDNGRAGAEYTNTRGNNVRAYVDQNSNNQIGFSPEGGNNLSFDFPFSSNQQPSQYQAASVTNLFYGNNMVHDVWYEAGFDEVSGNFQENNYGNGGRASDYVNAELDIGPFNNANMSTQADGTNPRMQMYLWNTTNPNRDGNFDSGIVIHEYGHGISIRLAGGPGTAGCLSGQEQAGEGWSDWFALMMTMNEGDVGTSRRGIGTYALGQATTGTGIRAKPYSTSFSVNNFTYDDIKSQVAPHGVGSVFATILWDLTWAFVDKYGFTDDVYTGDAGNTKVMQLVLDGLKLQPCGGGQVDFRDAILAADRATTGGADACTIWSVFAKRGLGFSADQGNPGSKADGTEAFDIPEADIAISTTKDACGSEVPQITVTNFTNTPVSSIDYTYRIDGGATQNGTWTGNIGACEAAPITIDLGTLSRGSHVLEIATVNPAGSASATISVNDNGTEDVVNTFENASDELIAFNATGTASLWERGTAAGTLLSNANAGSQVYGTNLDGTPGNDTKAFLVSQCYDLSTLDDASVEFNLGFDIEDVFDLLTFEYSKDGGATWEILGTANDPDWFNSDAVPNGTNCQNCVGAQWLGEGEKASTHSAGGTNAQMKLYKHSLAAFDSNGSAEENMLFRFVFISDPGVNEEGAIIDNFVIKGDATLSVDDKEFEGLSFFPNPTTGVVTIQSATSLDNAKVSINDIMGRVLTNGISINTVGDNKITVDLGQFATGSYFLTIENGSKKSTRQIIKK